MSDFNLGRMLRYLCSPTKADPTTFYVFLTLTFLLSVVISFLFHAVIVEKQTIEQNVILQSQRDGELFVEKIRNNEINLHRRFSWINDYARSINSSCAPVATSVIVIRYCGYTFAVFNTVMMHFVLQEKFAVTITSLIPLILSLIGGSIPPAHIVFFGLIESLQIVIGFAIISVGFFSLVYPKRLHEEAARSLTD